MELSGAYLSKRWIPLKTNCVRSFLWHFSLFFSAYPEHVGVELFQGSLEMNFFLPMSTSGEKKENVFTHLLIGFFWDGRFFLVGPTTALL